MHTSRTGRDVAERRAKRRYPLELRLRFLTRSGSSLTVTGEGTSINMSSTGMLFRSPRHLVGGERVIAVIEWPPAPDGRKPVLLVEGAVVWTKGLRVGMTLSHYRFLPDEIQSENELHFELPRPLTPTKESRSQY